MKVWIFVSAFCIGAVLLTGCDEPFSPKGPFQEKVVVYSVLSHQTDTQFVRLFLTYDPPGFDPLEQNIDRQIVGAQVTMSDGNQTVAFRDTTIARWDTSRYTTPIRAYVGHPFRPVGGRTYSLTIQTPQHGIVTSATTVPGPAIVDVVNPYVLTDPARYPTLDIVVALFIAPATRGYLTRFFIEYEIVAATSSFIERVEVPSFLRFVQDQPQKLYPALARRISGGNLAGDNRETSTFSVQAYSYALAEVRSKYAGNIIRFRRAIFFATQVDVNLYNYYNIANGFQDPYSIRQDLPDYTNIKGGLGMFGAFTVDSVSVGLNF